MSDEEEAAEAEREVGLAEAGERLLDGDGDHDHDDEDDAWQSDGDDAPPSGPATATAGAGERAVLHVDLDCFYAQVEERLHPELAGRPLGVLQRTFLVTCNYAARARGVRKLMPLFEAQAACPDIAVVPSVMEHYRDASRRVFAALRTHALTVEQASIDEAYLEVPAPSAPQPQAQSAALLLPPEAVCVEAARPTAADASLCAAARLAAQVRASVMRATGLTCTVGVARNKALAKLASTLHKPDRVSVLLPAALPALFARLPLTRMPSIGPKLAATLRGPPLSCTTVASVAALTVAQLHAAGVTLPDAQRLAALVRGEDARVVRERGAPRTVSVEQSFIGGARCRTWEDVEAVLRERATLLAARLAVDRDLFHRDPALFAVRYRLAYAAPLTRSAAFPSVPVQPSTDAQQAAPWIAAVVRAALALLRRNVPLAQLVTITRLGVAATGFAAHAPPAASIERFLVRPGSRPTPAASASASASASATATAAVGTKRSPPPPPKAQGIKRFLLTK